MHTPTMRSTLCTVRTAAPVATDAVVGLGVAVLVLVASPTAPASSGRGLVIHGGSGGRCRWVLSSASLMNVLRAWPPRIWIVTRMWSDTSATAGSRLIGVNWTRRLRHAGRGGPRRPRLAASLALCVVGQIGRASC